MRNLLALQNEADQFALQGVLPDIEQAKHGDICLANDSRFNQAYFNEPLTTYAVGWRDEGNIEAALEFFAPAVPAPRRFTYREWTNNEMFLSDTSIEDIRAIGDEFKEVKFTSKETLGKTKNKGLMIRVDMDEVRDIPNWRKMYTGLLLARLKRSELRRAVALLSAAANNTAKTWDITAGKDPDQDVIGELITAKNARGMRCNRVGYGDTAWQKRGLAHRAQNTAGGFASASLTPQALAGLLGVEQVLISGEVYQTTATAKASIVNDLVLMFHASSSPLMEDPSNIKRFTSPTDGGGPVRVYEWQIGSKAIAISVEHYSDIVITSTLGIRKFTVS